MTDIHIATRRIDLIWRRGIPWEIEVASTAAYIDDAEVRDLDLSEGSLTAEVRASEALDSTLLVTPTVTVIDDVGGVSRISLTAAQTDACDSGTYGHWFLFFTPTDETDALLVAHGTVDVREPGEST